METKWGESWLFRLPIIDLVLKQVHASVILQPILQTSTEEAHEDGFLLLFDRWQTSPQPCTCC